MLARRPIPEHFHAFNRRWGAPEGGLLVRLSGRQRHARWLAQRVVFRAFPQLRGMFSVQQNNSTRRFEYPWAFHATPLHPGMRVVEIGGGLSGFQFVLAKHGLKVTNVDPGLDASGRGWLVDEASLQRLNRRFGTDVRLERCTLQAANIPAGSLDRIFSVSALEHIPESQLPGVMQRAYELLKPGGCFIATIDLFLNLAPFTTRRSNEYGVNISVRRLIEAAPFQLVVGVPSQLCGFEEMVPEAILSHLERYVVGDYPVLVQTLVLRKPEPDPGR